MAVERGGHVEDDLPLSRNFRTARCCALSLNCNNQCHEEGLQPTKNPRACHLCGEGSVLNMMRCGACFGDPGRYECPTCGFRCCGRCWKERRPASALLRVCLREGLVPLEDAKNGVVLGVSLEGETQCATLDQEPLQPLRSCLRCQLFGDQC